MRRVGLVEFVLLLPPAKAPVIGEPSSARCPSEIGTLDVSRLSPDLVGGYHDLATASCIDSIICLVLFERDP